MESLAMEKERGYQVPGELAVSIVVTLDYHSERKSSEEQSVRRRRACAASATSPRIDGNSNSAQRDLRQLFATTVKMFDPDRNVPPINRHMVYLGACLIAGIRLAREKQVNTRVIPTRTAIDESVSLAHEVYCNVFRIVPETIEKKWPK